MANYNSSLITRGDAARVGVYPQVVAGVVYFSAVTLLTADTIALCQIPYGCYISDFKLWHGILCTGGSMTLSLADTLASATTYITTTAGHATNYQAAGILTMPVDFAPATVGDMYGSTSRAVSAANGLPVLVWAATAWNSAVPNGVGLILNVVAGGTGAMSAGAQIRFIVQFSPCTDMGV